MAQKHGQATQEPSAQRPQGRSGAARDRSEQSYSPFALMRLGIDEMDRLFNRLTGDRHGPLSHWPSSSPREWMSSVGNTGQWAPPIEAFQRGNEFVVRADVPGMTRPELNVEVGDDTLTISGERKSEQHHENEGTFWTERTYGSFCRTIPLPPGAIGESTKASFSNGVLEVVIQAPPQEARRGRKIDISGTPHEPKS